MSSADYKVAVQVTLVENVTRGLMMMSRHFRTTNLEAAALESKLKAIGKLTLAGGLMFGAGAAGLKTLEGMVKGGEEYTRQISLMNAAGMKQKEIAEAVGAAWKTSGNVISSSAADNLKTLRELRTVFFGRMEEAYAVLPQVERATGIMEALTGRKQEGIGFDMVKAIERRSVGNVSAASLQANSELMTRAMLGMSGTVGAHDFHQALSKAKLTALTLNDDFIYKILPTLIQINKGGGQGGAEQAGTQIATASRAIVQGRMLKSMYPMWEQMGLINGRDIVHNAGGSVSLKPGAVKGVDLYQANPYDWANQVLAPAVKAYSASHHMTMAQTLLAMFSDRNAANLFGSFILQGAHYERDRRLIDSVGTSKAGYDKLMRLNPQLAQMALEKQWQNIQAVIAYDILPILVPLMVKFANALNTVAVTLKDHPTATKWAIGGFAALSGAAMVGGALTLFTAGFRALALVAPMFGIVGTTFRIIAVALPYLVTGLRVLAAGIGIWGAAAIAVAWLVYNNWKEIKSSLTKVWGDMKDAVMKLFHGDILGALQSWGGAMIRGFQVIFNTIIAGVNAILPSAMAISKFHFADDYDAWRNGHPTIRPGSTTIHATIPVHVGNKHLATYLTDTIVHGMGRPNSGPNRFDAGRARPMPGM